MKLSEYIEAVNPGRANFPFARSGFLTPRGGLMAAGMVMCAGLIAMGVYYVYRPGESSSRDASKPAKQLYTCSMHPQVLKDKPGSCPICHMALTAVKNHSHGPKHNHGGEKGNSTGTTKESKVAAKDTLLIRVKPAVIQKMGVSTRILRKEEISREIRAAAHVEFNEKNQVIINSRVNGWVEKLYARYTGQKVRRGQALAGIYSPELVSTQEEYLQLYNKFKGDDTSPELKRLLAAARKRLRYWNISEAQIKRIETSGKVSRLLTLYSPYSGVITEKKVIRGARITIGADLFKIVDLSTVWAFVHIPEKDIPFVREGMQATMLVPQVPGKTFPGRVSFIFPYMDSKARDLKVRVSFRNRRFQLRPGMYATILLKNKFSKQFVTAPSSAVIRTGTRELVFVYRGNGEFEPREVQTGAVGSGDRVQILSGLREGEAVVVSGQFLLDSETRIQEAVRKLRAVERGTDGKKHGTAPGGHKH